MYTSIIQIGFHWRIIKYNKALQVIENVIVSYNNESEYLNAILNILSKIRFLDESQEEPSELNMIFIWFDLTKNQIDSLRASFPNDHLNTLNSAFYTAPPNTLTHRMLTLNLSQATSYWVDQNGQLSDPIDASILSLSSLLRRFCLRHRLAESNWHYLYQEWINTQAESIDAFQWAEYLQSPQKDSSLLCIKSACLEKLGLSLSLLEITEELRDDWFSSLRDLDLLSCTLVSLTGCLISDLLSSFGMVQEFTSAQNFITEQIIRAPHRGNHHILSGLNACDLSLKIVDPLLLNDHDDQREPLLYFAAPQREQSIYLMSMAPLEVMVSFGLDEHISLMIDPSTLGPKVNLDHPLSLSLSFDQTALLIIKQDDLLSFVKVTSC